jgi:hypothetical protein
MEREVAQYFASGESDPLGTAFPGNDAFERMTKYDQHLREALLQEVQRRERGQRHRHMPEAFDPVTWTHRKVKPMIAGLFTRAEQAVVLGVAERSIVFLTRESAH